MAAFLIELFDTPGNLNLQYPSGESPWTEARWATTNATVTCVTNYAIGANSTPDDLAGVKIWPDVTSTVTAVYGTVDFKTGSTATDTVFVLEFFIAGEIFWFNLVKTGTPNTWNASVQKGAYSFSPNYGSTPVPITLDPNTFYTFKFSVTNGAQSLEVESLAWSITDSIAYGSAATLSSVGMWIGMDSQIAALSLSEATGVDAIGIFDLLAPLPEVDATGFPGTEVSLTGPTGLLESFGGGYISATSSVPTVSIDVTSDALAEVDAFVPVSTVLIFGGVNVQLTAPTSILALTGTFVVFGAAALTSPSPTVAATGRVSSIGNAAVESPSMSLISYGGAVCAVTLTGRPTVTATGTSGSVGHAAITAPLFQLVASATAQNHGSINLIAPSGRLGATARAWLIAPGATLTAIGTATVAATYEAYAINLKHIGEMPDQVTRYTNFPFDRIVRYRNSYYGMNSTGLYLLEGTTDDGDDIAWEVETHITDFGSPKLKTVERAYFGGRLGPDATVTLSVGEKADNSYSYTTPRGATVQNHRQVFGKGAKARYFSLGVSGTDDFELDSLELAVTELARRI